MAKPSVDHIPVGGFVFSWDNRACRRFRKYFDPTPKSAAFSGAQK
jgi:hypothetical protein